MKIAFPFFLISSSLLYAEQGTDLIPTSKTSEKVVYHFQYRGRFDIYDGVNKLAYGEDAVDAKGRGVSISSMVGMARHGPKSPMTLVLKINTNFWVRGFMVIMRFQI